VEEEGRDFQAGHSLGGSRRARGEHDEDCEEKQLERVIRRTGIENNQLMSDSPLGRNHIFFFVIVVIKLSSRYHSTVSFLSTMFIGCEVRGRNPCIFFIPYRTRFQ
jgi:hypothetical protein